MAWIESHQSLLRHKKTTRAIALLRVDRYKLIGHLQVLWWWGLDNLESTGDLGDLTNEEIAIAAEWDGDAEVFVQALTHAGFIDDDGQTRSLHDWWDYAGKLLDKRERDRARKEEDRRQKQSEPRSLSKKSADSPGAREPAPKDDSTMSSGNPAEVAEKSQAPNPTVPTEPKKEREIARENSLVDDYPVLRPLAAVLAPWEAQLAKRTADRDTVIQCLTVHRMEPALVRLAFDQAANAGAESIAYVAKCLRDWQRKGWHTVADREPTGAPPRNRGSTPPSTPLARSFDEWQKGVDSA